MCGLCAGLCCVEGSFFCDTPPFPATAFATTMLKAMGSVFGGKHALSLHAWYFSSPWTVYGPVVAEREAFTSAVMRKSPVYTLSFSLGWKESASSCPAGYSVLVTARSVGGMKRSLVGMRYSDFGVFEFTCSPSLTRKSSSRTAGLPAATVSFLAGAMLTYCSLVIPEDGSTVCAAEKAT